MINFSKKDFNPAQWEAIEYLDDALLVLAGAGSGKTRVITHKIAYLILNDIYKARNIVAVTFTNKAAREMLERVSKLIPKDKAKGLTVSTFHSLGLEILRSEADRVGYKSKFSILDSADSLHLIAEIMSISESSEDENQLDQLDSIKTQISLWKNAFVLPEQLIKEAQSEEELRFAKIYRRYQEVLLAYQSVDFDDLIVLPVLLFQNNSDILEKWRNKLRYLLVDEYQDTNQCQFQLIKYLASHSGNLTAVGDDDQAIYAWRGADIENIRSLGTTFPKLKVIKLEQNYRSTGRILRSANELIKNNDKIYDKKLWSEHAEGSLIHVIECPDELQEAETVVMRLIAHKFEHHSEYKDYAILYRGNHQAKVFEHYLRENNIPYQVSGGSSYFDKPEIKDIISYFRLMVNSDDDPAFIRAVNTPKRGFGLNSLELLGQYASNRKISLFEASFETGLEYLFCEEHQLRKQYEILQEFCQMINRFESRANSREEVQPIIGDLLQEIEYENYINETSERPKVAQNRWGVVTDFVMWIIEKAKNSEKNLAEMTQLIALINILEQKNDDETDCVKLSTLHASKGLEYPYVFLVGVEENILPHKESLDEVKVQEERRLMYVGITRAQRELFMTYCKKRKSGGEYRPVDPSRFIDELAQSDLRITSKNQATLIEPDQIKNRINKMIERLKK